MTRKRIRDILEEVGLEEADRRWRTQRQEVERLKYFENQVRDSRPARLTRALNENRTVWLQNYSSSSASAPIYIDDPIFRQVLIDKEIVPVFHHPIVQRLA